MIIMADDNINPKHYKRYRIEVIDMMIAIWGAYNTSLHCEMTAFKYRMRAGIKNSETLKEDLEKEQWYLDKTRELKSN